MSKKSVRRDPLMQRKTPLEFDNVERDELLALSDEQKQDRFLSRWMDTVHPFSAYPRVFKRGDRAADDANKIFREIKNFYKRYVINGEWSEKKYVIVINAIFEQRAMLGPLTIDRFGKTYDEGNLPSQRRLRAAEKK